MLKKVFIPIRIVSCVFLVLAFLNTPSFAVPDLKKPDIASGIVPYHDFAERLTHDFFGYLASGGRPHTIIIFSPDHAWSQDSRTKPFMTLSLEIKTFQKIPIDRELLRKLSADHPVDSDENALQQEVGLTNLIVYLRKYLPSSKLVPILIAPTASREDIEQLVQDIHTYGSPSTILISSTGFSKGLPPSAADLHDVNSLASLVQFRADDLDRLDVEFWQGLYATRFYARLQGKETPVMIGHEISSDDKTVPPDSITSCFGIVFEKGEGAAASQMAETFQGETMLVVSDMMFDRGVENLMKMHGPLYPFQKILPFLKGNGMLFGNLECPIVKHPKAFPPKALQFNVSPEVAETLSQVNFNLLTLANNHLLDGGNEGTKETRNYLEAKGISSVGDPLTCTEKHLFKKDRLVFLAFNKIFLKSCSDGEIVRLVRKARASHPESLLLVVPHWGNEYQLESSDFQKTLAHQMIEAGADMILGHHPHVVQEIELYQNKLIFYSLGNFIFDQYFSKEVQEELVVGIELYPRRIRFRIFPVISSWSQPALMTRTGTDEFLKRLAKKSSPVLSHSIQQGIIDLDLASKTAQTVSTELSVTK